MKTSETTPALSPTQLVGFLLWRTGILILAAYSFYRGSRLALEFLDLAPELELGLGLIGAGALLVLTSLIVGRVQDAREERRLVE